MTPHQITRLKKIQAALEAAYNEPDEAKKNELIAKIQGGLRLVISTAQNKPLTTERQNEQP